MAELIIVFVARTYFVSGCWVAMTFDIHNFGIPMDMDLARTFSCVFRCQLDERCFVIMFFAPITSLRFSVLAVSLVHGIHFWLSLF